MAFIIIITATYIFVFIIVITVNITIITIVIIIITIIVIIIIIDIYFESQTFISFSVLTFEQSSVRSHLDPLPLFHFLLLFAAHTQGSIFIIFNSNRHQRLRWHQSGQAKILENEHSDRTYISIWTDVFTADKHNLSRINQN